MAKISQYFKDKAKTIKDYPKTLIKAVYGDDGKRLDNIIGDITSDIDSTKAKIGVTDISQYSDGTVTGAIKSACDGVDSINSKLGNTDISAIGDGTVTGGLDALNSNLNKLVIYSNTAFLTAADGRIQLQTDYKPDKPYFLCCQFPNGFTGDIAQIDTNGLIVANYIYAPNATERFSGDLWVNLFGVFKIK